MKQEPVSGVHFHFIGIGQTVTWRSIYYMLALLKKVWNTFCDMMSSFRTLHSIDRLQKELA